MAIARARGEGFRPPDLPQPSKTTHHKAGNQGNPGMTATTIRTSALGVDVG